MKTPTRQSTKKRLLARFGTSRLFLSLAGAALALFVFVRITRELLEGEVGGFDRSILLKVASWRTPLWNAVAIDVTALGSVTVIVICSLFALLILLLLRDRMGAAQMVLASAGAGLLTAVTKNIMERTRPDEALRLVVASGFSYPSGHSVSSAALYLTIAIIACHHVQRSAARTLIIVAACALLMLVGGSRVYLGVHYATDVVSGISLGVAWALLLDVLFTRFRGEA